MIMESVIVCDPNMDKTDIKGHKVIVDENEYLFRLLEIPLDDYEIKLDDHSVLVKINAFSCNYRDKGILNHFLETCKTYSSKDSYLYSFFGSEFVGEVIEIGKCVKSLQVGDRVIPDNSYPLKVDKKFGGVVTNLASRRIQIFHDSCLVKVPDSMSNVEAAAFSLTASTAHSIVSKSNLKIGDKVLVTSLFSNTSLGCLELLKNIHGIEIYALTTHSKEALSLSEDFRIRHIFKPDDFSDVKSKMNISFNVIIDPYSDIHINYLLPYLDYYSRYISCGVSSSRNYDPNFYKFLYNMVITNSSFIGNCLGQPNNLKAVINEYNHGRYNIYVDSVYSGEQISDFLNKSFNKRHFGKVVYSYE